MCRFCQNGSLTRREVVGGLAAAAILAGARPLHAEGPAASPERPYLEAAAAAGRWLARHALAQAQGVAWAADPNDPTSVGDNLYSGSAGVVLFEAELAQATGDAAAMRLARDGARALAHAVASGGTAAFLGERAGLYTGLAGISFALERAATATGDQDLHAAARSAAELLGRLAAPGRSGTKWSDSNDVVSGSAGIGLTLLWANATLGLSDGVEVAARAGRALIAAGIPSHGGLTWPISPSVPRRYPNFSHGAAGASYFLATLYGVTHDRTFLDGALAGARYLQAVATDTPSGGKMIFHSEPGNEQLYYLSWCHGPSGTARLFHRLQGVTRDAQWAKYADQLNTATRDMRVPERSPGFWNNVSQCCGNCGVIEHVIALHDRTGDTRYVDDARRLADDVIARATPDGDALKWIQAEHRVRPELLVAQTGLMQGAAGMGLAMLHLDGALSGRRPFVVLPDSPYFA